MEANEAPEKLYVDTEDRLSDSILYGFTQKRKDDDIEYTRTDAFIEKAVAWLNKNADKYIWYSDYAENAGDDTCGMNDDFIEDFKKYKED